MRSEGYFGRLNGLHAIVPTKKVNAVCAQRGLIVKRRAALNRTADPFFRRKLPHYALACFYFIECRMMNVECRIQNFGIFKSSNL